MNVMTQENLNKAIGIAYFDSEEKKTLEKMKVEPLYDVLHLIMKKKIAT